MRNYQDVVVVSAPSGTGKTTINRRLVQLLNNVQISVSYTTRQKRASEIHGDHYWFVSEQEFRELIAKAGMVEWAQVHGYYYGTSFNEVHRILDLGCKAILEIDVQGWIKAKQVLPGATAVMILPPSIEILKARLSKRGTDNSQEVKSRLQTANKELQQAHYFDHFMINEQLEKAIEDMEKFFLSQSVPFLSFEDGCAHSVKLISEFNDFREE